jgi:hypothetical protein
MTEIRNGTDWPRKSGWYVNFRDEHGATIPEDAYLHPTFIEVPTHDYGQGPVVEIPSGATVLVISPKPDRCLANNNGLLCELPINHPGNHLATQAVWE